MFLSNQGLQHTRWWQGFLSKKCFNIQETIIQNPLPTKKHPQKHNLPTKRLKWILFETGGGFPKIFLLVPDLLPRLEGFPYDIENYSTFEVLRCRWPAHCCSFGREPGGEESGNMDNPNPKKNQPIHIIQSVSLFGGLRVKFLSCRWQGFNFFASE